MGREWRSSLNSSFPVNDTNGSNFKNLTHFLAAVTIGHKGFDTERDKVEEIILEKGESSTHKEEQQTVTGV